MLPFSYLNARGTQRLLSISNQQYSSDYTNNSHHALHLHPQRLATTIRIQLDNRPREITRQPIIIRIPPAIHALPLRPIRTTKPHLRRTTPHDIKAHVLTGLHLLVRAGLNLLVDERIPTASKRRAVVEPRNHVGKGAVGKRCLDIPRDERRVVCGPVFAARHENHAEPGFVVFCTVVAGAGERVLRFRDGVASNLCQRLCEVVVVFTGLVVVDCCEGRVVVFEAGVGWYGVGDRVTKFEVEEDLAGVVWVWSLV